MPWMTVGEGDKTCVYKKGSDGKATGKSLGCHDSQADADDQMAALYASEDRGRGIGQAFIDGIRATVGQWFSSSPALPATLPAPLTDATDALTSRAISIGDIYSQVSTALYEADPNGWPWIEGLYAENERLYCIVSNGGKLYRYDVAVDGTNVSIGEQQEVEIQHVAASAGDADDTAESGEYDRTRTATPRTETLIMRQRDGRTRWVSRSCSSVLNRVGEFDTRALFDSFVAHAKRTGEYPYRTFYHEGERLRTGQADFLAREGDIYITSGLYDLDNLLAEVEIAARLAQPTYYGESIGYSPTAEPETIRLTDDITAYAYTEGVHREISTVVETEAAALFTGTSQMEVSRMKNTKADKRLREIFELAGRADEADGFIASIDDTNRSIADDKLITRTLTPVARGDKPADDEATSDDTPAPDSAQPDATPADDTPAATVTATVTATAEAPTDDAEPAADTAEDENASADESLSLTLDDDTVRDIATLLANSDDFVGVIAASAEFATLVNAAVTPLLATQVKAAVDAERAKYERRLATLEDDYETRTAQYQADTGRVTIRGTRPSQKHRNGNTQPDPVYSPPATLGDEARDTLAQIGVPGYAPPDD